MGKILRGVLVCFSGLAVLAGGCGKKEFKGITWAVGRDVTGAQAELVRSYNQAHPEFPVRLLEMPESSTAQHDAYVTHLAGKDPSIDLYTLDVVWTAEFASAGWVKPVDLLLGEDLKKDFLPGPLESCRFQGKTWGLPWFTDAGILYYRKDLLRKAGLKPPRTWGELTRTAKILSKKYNMPGYVFQAYPYEGLVCNYLEWLWGAGGSLAAADGKIQISSPQAVEALTAMRSVFQEPRITPAGVLTFKEEESRRAFTDGMAVFLRNWPYVWALAQGKDSKVAGKVGMTLIPGKKGPSSSTLGGWNLALSAYSRKTEAAWDFIQYLVSEKVQKQYAIQGGRLPARRSVYGDKELKSAAPQYGQLLPILEKARPRPVIVGYAALSDQLQVAVHQVLSGQAEPSAVLRKADENIHQPER